MKKTVAYALVAATVLGIGTGCGTSKNESVKLKWYMPITTNADNDEVFKKASEHVKEKIGAELEIIPLEFANYESKVQVLNASAEVFDLMFTSNWSNSYYNNVSKKTLLELDTYLNGDFKDLYDEIPDYMWEASKVGGKIYAIPNQQICARAPFFIIPKKNIDAGVDVSAFKDNMTHKEILPAIENYVREVAQKSGNYVGLSRFWNGTSYVFGMEEVTGSSLPGVVRYNGDEPTKVINQYESEEFKEYIKWRRKLVEEKLIQQDPTEDMRIDYDSGEYIPSIGMGTTWKPGIEAELEGSYKYGFEILGKTTPILTGAGITATMNGISITSENPDKTMELIRLLNTDKELYNLLSFGIENKNYKKTGENRIEQIADRPFSSSNWAIGSVYNSYLLPSQADDVWEATKNHNDNAQRSPLLGFTPNLESVDMQIVGCRAVVEEFLKTLDFGVGDVDSVYEKFISKLKAAGCDDIIAEEQKQIDKWLAEN